MFKVEKQVFNRQSGVTLIEMLISMAIGLFISSCFVIIFFSAASSQTHLNNMSRLQEDSRYAFNTLTTDIREAGGIYCGSNLEIANALNINTDNEWWAEWRGIEGYESTSTDFPYPTGTGVGERVAGTDGIVVQSGTMGSKGIGLFSYRGPGWGRPSGDWATHMMIPCVG